MRLTAATTRFIRMTVLNFKAIVFFTGLVAACQMCTFDGIAFAQEPVNPAKVRTAYLYQFMRFIDWPEKDTSTGNDSNVICIPSRSNEFGYLDLITQKTVNDRAISIERIDDTTPLTLCQILYLVNLKPNEQKHYVKKAQNLPILTIGNSSKFLATGGIIAFNVGKGQVTFSVNLKVAGQASLKISANMLDVAEKVIK